MKQRFFQRLTAMLLAVTLVASFGYVPMGSAAAEVTEETVSVQDVLGENWNVSWNGGTAADADYLTVVEGGAHGNYALRIGHPTAATELCLRYDLYKADMGLAASEALGMGMKFSAKIEGALKSGSWIGVINPVAGAGGNNRSNLSDEDIASIGADWTRIDKDDEYYGVWCGGEYDHVKLEFNLVLDAGNYFYLDDLQGYGFWGNIGDMAYVNVVHNGSFERWYCAWNAQETTTGDTDFARIVEGGRTGNALRLGSSDKVTDYTLHLQLPVPQAGAYSFDLWARSEGSVDYASFELFDGSLSGAVRRYPLAGVGSEWTHVEHAYDTTDVWVNSDTLLIQLYVYLPAGSYLYLDDIHIVKGLSNDLSNMLYDGGFEGYPLSFIRPGQQPEPEKPGMSTFVSALAAPANWYCAWNEFDQYRSDYLTTQAHSGNYALALTGLESGLSYTIGQKVEGLEPGVQYTFEGWFKKLGNFSYISIMQGATFLQLKDESMEDWTLFTGSFTAGSASEFSIFAVCPQGGQLLVDDLKIYKADDADKTNLLTNGDFEAAAGSADRQLKLDNAFDTMPVTVEAALRLPLNGQGGVIFGNRTGSNGYNVGINALGQPYVSSAAGETVFDAVDVRTGETMTLTVTNQNGELSCYVDGGLKQTVTSAVTAEAALYEAAFCIGGDNTAGNESYFTGDLISVSVSGAEGLLAAWDLENALDPNKLTDTTGNGYDALYYGTFFNELQSTVTEKYPYSFAVVGDTQYTNRGDTQNRIPGADYMDGIYQWILDNQETYNIQAVLGMGDIADTSPSTTDESAMTQSLKEWEHAVQTIGKLHAAGIPYTLVKGNHDSIPEYPENDISVYESSLKKLGYDTQIDGWYEAGGSLANAYITLTVGQTKWLILTLDYNHSEDEIAWAAGIIESHSDHKVIVTTHAYLNANGEWLKDSDRCELVGEDLWDILISQYENIELVLCGHIHSNDVVVRQRSGKGNNVVTEMLIDSQSLDRDDYLSAGKAPYAMVTLLLFSEDGEEVMVANHATGKGKFYNASAIQTVDLSDGQEIIEPEEPPVLSVPLEDREIPGWVNTWNGNNAVNYRYLTTYAHSGSYALALTGVDADMDYTYTQYLRDLEVGEEYTLEGYFLRSGEFGDLVVMLDGNSNKTSLKDLTADQWTKVSATFTATDTTASVELYGYAEAGALALVDDVTVYKTSDTNKTNLVENPGFEVVEDAQTDAPVKAYDFPTGWERWAENEDLSQLFVTKQAREGNLSFAFVNKTKQAASLTQTVTDLPDGTYILSAYVRSSGGQEDAVLIAKGFDKENPDSQMGVQIPKSGIWIRIEMEIEVTGGQVLVSFWNVGNAGNWILADQVELISKTSPAAGNLLTNGGFEKAENDPLPQKPISVELIDTDIPGWSEAWNEFPENNYRYLTTHAHSGKYALALTSKYGKLGYTFAQRLDVEPGVSYTLEGYVYKSGELDAADILIGPNGIYGKLSFADERMNGYQKVKLTFKPATDYLELGIFAAGPRDSLLMVDDLCLYKTGDAAKTNLLINGDFETLEEVQTQPPVRAEDYPEAWELWAENDDLSQIFVTEGGRDGQYAMGFANTAKQANSLTQTVTGLEDGTYVLTAYVKSGGGQNDAAMLLKGYDKENVNGQSGVKIPKTGIWLQLRLEVEVTSGQVLVSFWNDANEGNWLMVDQVCLYRKDDTAKTNLLQNGSFESILKAAGGELPPAGDLPESATVPTDAPDEEPQPQPEPDSNVGIWIGIGALILVLLAVLAFVIKKKSNHQR